MSITRRRRQREKPERIYVLFLETPANPMRMTFYLLALLMVSHSDVYAQEDASPCMEQAATLVEPHPVQQLAAKTLSASEKHRRLFWIVPTFTVSDSRSPSTLTSDQKFGLFFRDTTDPYTLIYTAFSAGIQQANNSALGYGHGGAGYGKRVAAGLADETASGFFRTYLFPSVLRQDPRYFRKGSGPLKDRFMNAIIRPIVTRKDSGGRTFNWSGLLGGTAASGLANAYYPSADRGIEPTFKRVATEIPFSVIDHLIDEFGPDLEKRFLGRK